MDSSGMDSRTSLFTVTTPRPMYSRQFASVNRMSIGTSILQRTRAKQGRSHRRSIVRSRMVPSVDVERQLSNAMGMTGCVFSFVSFVPHPHEGTRP